MASAARTPYLSVEEYLSTTFRPDVDYVDGRIEERNLGEFDHGTLQGVLYSLFSAKRHEWKIRVALDTRVQVAAENFRVPDVSIHDASGPKEQIIRRAPLLCIEILSPEDTLRRMLKRIEDYFAMGVPHVWVFDPERRVALVCEPGGRTTEHVSGALTIPGTPMAVELDQVFSRLDED
jgi:Uma2 family endonuclease